MRNVLLILLLFSLSNCQPGKESPALSTALQEVECMIDQDSFPDKYVILYEVTSNDVGSVYKITSADLPFVEWSMERPEKVIKYKNRYICLISPTASTDISKKKLLEITNYQNDTVGSVREKIWYIGVSKYGEKHTLISAHSSYLTSHYYTFPQLLEYVFKDYNEVHLPRFILSTPVVHLQKNKKEVVQDQ